MGATHVTATIRNVDTGAIDSLVPRPHLEAIGLTPERRRVYELADGRTTTVDIAFGLIEFMGDVVAGTIIIGEPDTEQLLGVTALASAGIEVDAVHQRLTKLPAVRLKRLRRRT